MNRRVILLEVVFVLFLSLFFYGRLLAEERLGAGGKLVASTFKALAKTSVATTDIERLKQDSIQKINEMDEPKFRKQYAKVYATINQLPAKLKLEYDISERMTKEQVVRDIELLNKENIYWLIDSIPDTLIVSEFKRYLVNSRQDIQNNNLAGQAGRIWNKMIAKTDNLRL